MGLANSNLCVVLPLVSSNVSNVTSLPFSKVDEAGMAVGWPLGLGHDSTGWPLGLRLRLTQEDWQGPRRYSDDDSMSCSSDSSSFETESTRSFFQDKSISLGRLIGIPISHHNTATRANNFRSQTQRRSNRSSIIRRVIPTNTISGTRRESSQLHWQSRRNSRAGASDRRSSHASNHPLSARRSVSAGWALLSALSCARVPLDHESRSMQSSSVALGRGQEIENRVSSTASAVSAFKGQRPGAPTNKTYDNITFEEESVDRSLHSSELNPLFKSSPLEDDDHEDLEILDAEKEPVEHLRLELMRSQSSHTDVSEFSEWSSASESPERRKSSLLDAGNQHRSSAVHLMVSKMICCRHIPNVAN